MVRRPVQRDFVAQESALMAGIAQLHAENWIKAKAAHHWYLSEVAEVPDQGVLFCMGIVEFPKREEGSLMVIMVPEMGDPNLWYLDCAELWKFDGHSIKAKWVPSFHVRKSDPRDTSFSRVDEASVFTHFAFLSHFARTEMSRRLVARGFSPKLFQK